MNKTKIPGWLLNAATLLLFIAAFFLAIMAEQSSATNQVFLRLSATAINIFAIATLLQRFVIPRVQLLPGQFIYKTIVYGTALILGILPLQIFYLLSQFQSGAGDSWLSSFGDVIYKLMLLPFGMVEKSALLPSNIILLLTSGIAILLFVLFLGGLLALVDTLWRRERERNNVQALQLHQLHAQMQPHFLFNTLNTIVGTLRQDAEKAEVLLISLSDFYRQILVHNQHQHIALADEKLFLVNYFTLLMARFGKQLSWQIDFSKAMLNQKIPVFILQPLCENAIRHAWRDRQKPLHIDVIAQQINQRLQVQVIDSGRGFIVPKQWPAGHSLAIIAKRLQILGGRLEVISSIGKGSTMTVEI